MPETGNDRAPVGRGGPLALFDTPWQQAPCVAVVVDQHAARLVAPVLVGTMQEVAVEEHQGAGADLDRHFHGLVETVALRGEVELVGILVLTLGIKIAVAMGTGNNVEATVLDRGVVHGDPRANQGPVARGDEDLVLVPGLSLEPGRLDEVHGLHALDAPVPVRQVSRGDLAQYAADPGMAHVLLDYGTDEMRLMNTQDTLQHVFVGVVGLWRVESPAGVLAAGHVDQVVLQFLQFLAAHQVGYDEITVVHEELDLFIIHDRGDFDRGFGLLGKVCHRWPRLHGGSGLRF